MKNPGNIEKELNSIRTEIYEEIKDMSPSEMTAYMKAQVQPIKEKYGIRTENEIKTKQRRISL